MRKVDVTQSSVCHEAMVDDVTDINSYRQTTHNQQCLQAATSCYSGFLQGGLYSRACS
jgi:hypothetical protein